MKKFLLLNLNSKDQYGYVLCDIFRPLSIIVTKVNCQVTSLVVSYLESSLTGLAGGLVKDNDFHYKEFPGSRPSWSQTFWWPLEASWPPSPQSSSLLLRAGFWLDLPSPVLRLNDNDGDGENDNGYVLWQLILTVMMSQASCFVMGMELVGPSKRTLAGILCWWEIIVIITDVVIVFSNTKFVKKI